VTESALVDFEPAADALHRLRSLGIRLALDDFGTGYSSLSYLAKLPFDVVKIDRAFVGSLGQDGRVEALLTGIVGLCRGLELQLCAEGVETEAQFDVIRRLQFEAAQGFLFAKPASARSMVAVLGAGSEAPLRNGRVTTVERRSPNRGLGASTLPEAAA
jgi:EAL domain-containing protein (putative c-di-GMP-specific phosphodiesterase class I)